MSILIPPSPDLCLIDADCWAITTIWQEIRGGPYQDKVMVAEVIRDRTAYKYASDGTIAGTVLHAYQFSGWNASDPNRVPSGNLRTTDATVIECQKGWKDACQNKTSYAKGALLYHAKNIPYPYWTQAPAIVKVTETSLHLFYKDMKVQR